MNETVKKAAKKRVPTGNASVKLAGETKEHYDSLVTDMKSKVFGIEPNGAEVLRYALNIASLSIKGAKLDSGSTCEEVEHQE